MSTTVAIYQPRYFPRLHYLARMNQADIFVIYDDVEFSRQSRQHRAPIDFQTSDWLTIPVQHTGETVPITDALIDMSTPWIEEHLETLVHKYGPDARTLEPYYLDLLPYIPAVSAVRTAPNEVREALDSTSEATLETFLAADAQWREGRERLRELDSQTAELGERIGRLRSEGHAEDARELIQSSRELSEQIEPVREHTHAAKRRRDGALVELSADLSPACGIERMPPGTMWGLDGVDVQELTEPTRLVELTIPLLEALADRFGIETTLLRSSDIDVEHPGDASEYLAQLTAAVDGDTYVSGRSGYEKYVGESAFRAEHVAVTVQDWEPTWEAGNVCALDVLFTASRPGQQVD